MFSRFIKTITVLIDSSYTITVQNNGLSKINSTFMFLLLLPMYYTIVDFVYVDVKRKLMKQFSGKN